MVHAPAPVMPFGHGALGGRDALLLGVRDLLFEIFPQQSFTQVRQYGISHISTNAFNPLLAVLPPSGAGLVPPAAGVICDLVVGFVSLGENASFS